MKRETRCLGRRPKENIIACGKGDVTYLMSCGCITKIVPPSVCHSREQTVLYCHVIFQCTYFQIQVHHIVPMQEGHSSQDLLGQPDHIFLCEGLVVIGYTLVEDFATSGAGRKAQEGKLRKQNKDKTRKKKGCTWIDTQCSLVWLTFIFDYSF